MNLVRPEDDSLVFTGTAVIPAGADYPAGGTLNSLMVDPVGGTGGLTGPTEETWPTA